MSCRHRRKQARKANYAASYASVTQSQETSGSRPDNGYTIGKASLGGSEAFPTSNAQDIADHTALSTNSDISDEVNGEMSGEELSDSRSSCGEEAKEEADGQTGEEALVSIVTADFAMQNLILQLGLRLVSPDGRQIKCISRFALRCSACFKVTKVSQYMSHLKASVGVLMLNGQLGNLLHKIFA